MTMAEPTLFVREGDRIVPAADVDVELARRYPSFPEKGQVRDGYRLTILTHRAVYRVSEEIRVVHVCEAVAPGTELYVMGPKPVCGEYVDGRPATAPCPNPAEPLAPIEPYDGRVVPGPGIDTNYEITRYTFDAPGIHTIVWRLGELASNTRRIEITA